MLGTKNSMSQTSHIPYAKKFVSMTCRRLGTIQVVSLDEDAAEVPISLWDWQQGAVQVPKSRCAHGMRHKLSLGFPPPLNTSAGGLEYGGLCGRCLLSLFGGP